MILRLGLTQTVDRKYGEVTRNDTVWETLSILGYVTPMLGYSRTLTQYKDLKIAEAKLVKRGKDWYLFITFRKGEEKKKGESKEKRINN